MQTPLPNKKTSFLKGSSPLVFTLAFLLVFSIGSYALAARVTPYTPGETLDPTDCVPGDANCYVSPVYPLTAGGLVFTSSTGTLTQDNSSLFFDDSSNELGIGNVAPLAKLHVGGRAVNNSSDAQILISRAVDDTVSGNGHAFSDSSNVTRAGTIGYNSFDSRIDVSGTNNYDHFAGFQEGIKYASSGTVSDLYGFVSLTEINAGTVTRRYGVDIWDPTGAGTLTTNYGIHVQPLSKGATNYAVYTAGTTASYFGGNVGIGATTASAKAHILSTTEQLRLGYDASNYLSTTVGSTGSTIFDLTGTSPTFRFSDDVGVGTAPSAGLHVLKTTEQLRVGYNASNYFSTTVGSTGSVTFDTTGSVGNFTFDGGIFEKKGYTDTGSTTFRMGTGYELYGVSHGAGGYEYYLTNNSGLDSGYQINFGTNSNKVIQIRSNAVVFGQPVTLTTLNLGTNLSNFESSPYTGFEYSSGNGWSFAIRGSDDLNKFVISTTGNVGIGTVAGTISARAHIISTTEQLRVGYDTSNYYSTTVGSTGIVAFATSSTGTVPYFTFNKDATIYDVTVGRGPGAVASNTALGYQTLNSNTTGYNMVAIGYQAMYSHINGGDDNVAVGYRSLYTNNSYGNTAVGSGSLQLSTALGDTALGFNSGGRKTSGQNNVFIGSSAGYSMTGASSNVVAIGAGAFGGTTNASTVSHSTAVGVNALALMTGTVNNAFGYRAGAVLTTGNSNTYIGSFDGTGFDGTSNRVMISDGDGNLRIHIDNEGDMGVGTSTNTVSARVHAIKTTEQLRLGYDTSNYLSFTVSASGSLAIAPNNAGVSMSLGNGASATSTSSLAIGNSASSSLYGTAIGVSAVVSGNGGVALGRETTSGAQFAVAIGYASTANNQYAAALTPVSTANFDHSVAIGYASATTAASQIRLGTASYNTSIPGTLSIGQSTGTAKLDVLSTTEQLRLAYDGTWYTSFTVASNGALTIDAAGGGTNRMVRFSDDIGVGTSDATLIDNTAYKKLLVEGGATQSVIGIGNNSGQGYFAFYDSDLAGVDNRVAALTAVTQGSGYSDLRFGTANGAGTLTTGMTLSYEGKLGVGTLAPGYKFDVNDDVASYTARVFNDGNNANRSGLRVQAGLDDHTAAGPSTLIGFFDGDGGTVGSITFGSSATAYNTTSDARLKQNVVDTALSIDLLNQIQIRDYTWVADQENKLSHGVLAQELYGIYPEAVTRPLDEQTGYWMVDYSKLVPLVIRSVQQLDVKIQKLSSLDTNDAMSLGSLVRSFLENATNGVRTIFSDKVQTKELCLEDVCVTKSQLQQLLSNQSGTTSGTSSGSGTSGTTGDNSGTSGSSDGDSGTTGDTSGDTSDTGTTGDTGTTDGGDITGSDTGEDTGGTSGDTGTDGGTTDGGDTGE